MAGIYRVLLFMGGLHHRGYPVVTRAFGVVLTARQSSPLTSKCCIGRWNVGFSLSSSLSFVSSQQQPWQRWMSSVGIASLNDDGAVLDRRSWEFLSSSNNSDDHSLGSQRRRIRNILVCGDGDLSYSATIAPELEDVQLVATVLETEEIHNKVYEHSKMNTNIITSSSSSTSLVGHRRHKVLFGIDATNLTSHFIDDEKFDRIQFNFPHWKGKANNRYNRILLANFLSSASNILSPHGEIHVALCDGQGGSSSTTLQQWRGSWQASMLAADTGLLLVRVSPYKANYKLSSHREKDRPFNLGKDPMMHIFIKPDGILDASRDIQLCCRHELHIVIPTNNNNDDDTTITSTTEGIYTLNEIVEGDAIQHIIQNHIVPNGVRVEVPARQIVDINETQNQQHGVPYRVCVFLIAYCGEKYPITRQLANTWRIQVEEEVAKYIPLRDNRKGRTVSRPFPYTALYPEIKYRHVWLDQIMPDLSR
jgi:hypothetical protein